MLIRQDGLEVQVLAPAKLNLFLEILGKRSDGYHEIETLITAIDRFDRLSLRAHEDSNVHLNCQMGTPLWQIARAASGDGASQLPPAEDNLVYRALRALQERSGCRQGAVVTLQKTIPPASGLGGGSSDAAAALIAANRAWNLNLPREELSKVAAELGSDIPFFLSPWKGSGARMALCQGRGEEVHAVEAPAGMHFVVVRPGVGLSTPEVYRHCRVASSPVRADQLVSALRAGNHRRAKDLMFNRLQPAAASVDSVVEKMSALMDATGTIAHQLSGSGSAYFGWFASTKAAQVAAGKLRAQGIAHVWQAKGI